ncbi:hypothetical protein B0H12DRAFT_360918 [Mycena haematopus]|nr:hypothetical protein B0H12DRAFT_360918 [Mycena haematopus]
MGAGKGVTARSARAVECDSVQSISSSYGPVISPHFLDPILTSSANSADPGRRRAAMHGCEGVGELQAEETNSVGSSLSNPPSSRFTPRSFSPPSTWPCAASPPPSSSRTCPSHGTSHSLHLAHAMHLRIHPRSRRGGGMAQSTAIPATLAERREDPPIRGRQAPSKSRRSASRRLCPHSQGPAPASGQREGMMYASWVQCIESPCVEREPKSRH